MSASMDARAVAAARSAEPWVRTAQGDRPAAVVLGGDVNGLAFVRSLGRRGIPTLVVERWFDLGMSSRFGNPIVVPDEGDEHSSWIDVLELVGSRLDTPAALLPTSDATCRLVARHEERLDPYFRFLVPRADVVDRIIDKRAQYELAREAGIRIPAVRFPKTREEVDEAATRIGFPCLLKPHESHTARERLAATEYGGRKLFVIGSATELVKAYERLTSLGVAVMVQELIPGDDTELFGYIGFWDSDGRERAWVTKRKLRQNPPGFGDGSLQVTVDAPVVAELSRRIVRAFDTRGLVNVELKRDPRDGLLRLIEVNPRSPSSLQMAVSAGVDLPWIAYRHLCGSDAIEPAISGRPGVVYVNEIWDARAFGAMRRAGDIGLLSWLSSLRRVRSTAIWARDDRGPFLSLLERETRGLVRAMRSRLAIVPRRS